MKSEEHRVEVTRTVRLDGLGPRVAERRKACGWSQGELSRRAGIRPERLSRIERDLRRPNVEELARLAVALSSGIDALVFGTAGDEVRRIGEALESLVSPEEQAMIARVIKAMLLGFSVMEKGKGQETE